MSSQIFTVQGADGRGLQAAQPAGNVTGSPFAVTAVSAVATGDLIGLVIICATVDVHIKFTKDNVAVDATTNDIYIPANQWFSFPADGEKLSMLGTEAGNVYVELGKTV